MDIDFQVQAGRAVLKLDAIPDNARVGLVSAEELLASKLEANIRAAWPRRTGKSAKRIHHRVTQSAKSVTAKVYATTPLAHLIEGGTAAHLENTLGRHGSKQALRFMMGAEAVFAKYVHHPGIKANPIFHREYDAMLGEIEAGLTDAVRTAAGHEP